LIFLITWSPTENKAEYTAYEVKKQDVVLNLKESGIVSERVIDEQKEKVVEFYIDEYVINKFATDQEITLVIPALNTDERKGKIYEIANEPRITGDETTYLVVTRFNIIPENQF